jgi:hypothetical protein
MATGTISVLVNKALPAVSILPTPSAITYGQSLQQSVLSGGSASVDGVFSVVSPSSVPNAGLAAVGVVFTPIDVGNYLSASGSVSVQVNKAMSSITGLPVASPIIYGQPLSASTLSAGEGSVAGGFAFSAPAFLANAGTSLHPVVFNPTDSSNYLVVSGSVEVTVAKAGTTVNVLPLTTPIVFGQPLSASTLSAGSASVDGNFVFTNPAFIPAAGTSQQQVSFLPADSLNYSASGTLVSVVVNKVQPVVNVPPVASGIVYGQTLASSTLTAGEGSVPGTFAYSAPSSAPAAGLYSAAVTFTPSDAVSYLTAGTLVSVEVNKAVPLILEMPVAGSISYGEPLGNSALVGGSASVSGAFEFTSPGNTPNAGVNSV